MADERIPVAGMGDDVPLLKGLDGVLKSADAAMQAVRDAAGDMRVIAQRQGQYAVRASDEENAARQRQATSTILAAADEIGEGGLWAPRQKVPSTADSAVPPPVEPPPPNTAARKAPPPPPDPLKSNQETFEHYRDYFGGKGDFSLRNVRKSVGSRIESATESPWGEQLSQTDSGQWVDQDGNFASNAAIMAFMRREKTSTAVRGFGQSLAKGQTMRQAGMGAAPGVIAKGAGIAGAALFAGQQAGDFFEGQRAANAEWQSIYGGTNIGGVGERLKQKMFGLSQFGFMDSDKAERLFRGVSETGLKDDDRQQSLDFATSMYSELGMSVEQSMKLIRTAAETGQESLGGVAVALKQVSESAVEAGVNAEAAREKFIRSWQGIVGQAGGGAGSSQLAAGFSAAEAGMGREYQGVSYGWTDDAAIWRMTAQTGQSYNQVVSQMSADPQGFAGARVGMIQEDIKRVFRPGGYEAAMSYIRQQQASGNFDDTTAAQALLSNDWLWDLPRVRQILSGLNIADAQTPFDAAIAIVGVLSGELDPVGKMAEQQAEAQTQQLFDPENADLMEVYNATAGAMEGVHNDRGKLGLGVSWLGADVESNRISQAYESHIKETGSGGGIAGRIAETASLQDEIGKVAVETSEGVKVMDIWDAIRHYGDQVNRGEVEVVGGTHGGKSLAEAVGMGHGDTSVGSDVPTDAGVGESASEFESRVGVTLDLTPEARRMVQAYDMTGSVAMEDEYSPSNQHLQSGNYPTGNP